MLINKFIIFAFVLFLALPCFASELTDDYIDMASERAENGDYKSALNDINFALQYEPNNKNLLYIKSVLNQVLQPKQFNTNQKIQNNFEYDAQNNLNQGISYYNLKDYDRAIECFQKYLSFNPKSDFAYTMLAKCYLEVNNINLALNNIEKAVNLSDNVENKMLQGKILYKKGYYVQAKNIFQALKITVQTSELYEYIGLCEYKLNNYAEALNNIDKAIILRDDANSLNLLYNEIKTKIETVN